MAGSYKGLSTIRRSLAVSFLLFNVATFLSSSISSTTVFTAEALPRPRSERRGVSSSGAAASVVRNPFLNQNVELTGNDGNHHDLVHAIMGSTGSVSLSSSKSATRNQRKSKRQLSRDVEASILNNNREPVLELDPFLFSHALAVEGKSGQDVGSKLKKRDITPPPGGSGSGGTFSTNQPLGRRRQGRTA
ncbi:hypothetical protein EMPS_03989 [Entomortierella parvispora]|uniref:Uncharacterized protein n=1 Tax=Entomortierella parvispora TaxID=205924 RepID=A0A9P3H7M8_9FUNG|nr:hypothetical protein EMPS_03989 [Entomortierella parvispora]